MRKIQYIFFGLFLLVVHHVYGQGMSMRDSIIPLIEETAYKEKNLTKAIDYLEQLMSLGQAQEEDSLQYARFNFWNRDHINAEIILLQLVKDHRDNRSYHLLLVDVLEVDGRFDESQEHLQNTLLVLPQDTELMYRYAYSSNQLMDATLTKEVLNEILELEPEHRKANLLSKELRSHINTNSLVIDHFGFGDLKYYSLSYGKKLDQSALFGRVSVAKREEVNGKQISVDWYRTIDRVRYVYFHLGYSNTLLYPRLRINAAYYQQLVNRLRGSLFLSYMDFRTDQIKLINPSLNYDFEDWMLGGSLSYVRGNMSSDWAYQFKLRRYADIRTNYIGLSYGSLSREDLNRFNAELDYSRQFIGIEGQVGLFKNHTAGCAYLYPLSKGLNNQSQLSLFIRVNF